ncbi:transposase [Halomonas cerina]|uniref:Transposase n=1 Tax=Halomonas cerina TaxID=447424 RepID=A0A839V0B6_9GAMM|nr:helix-turn-helix domain-containing protein [Halomonas cerina]MBB3189213.1 transposase [Halomonas cerina]
MEPLVIKVISLPVDYIGIATPALMAVILAVFSHISSKRAESRANRFTLKRIVKRRMTQKQIAEELDVHPLTVGRWLAKYREGGMKALLAQTRGRREGAGRQLTPDEEDRLQMLLVDKTPDQLKLPYALWTRQAVQQLIKQETGKPVLIRTVGGIPQALGLHRSKAQEAGL